MASFVLLWNGVVQAQLYEGVESCADIQHVRISRAADSLKTGLVKGKPLPGGD